MNPLLNFKSFFKFLGRNKAYTLIDVFGLSISLMFVLAIALYTAQEMSTDRFQEKGDRIYIVGSENYAETGAAIAYKLKERYPEVEKVCPVVTGGGEKQQVLWSDKKLKAEYLFADSTFFDLFSFPLVKGSASRRWPPWITRSCRNRSPARCSARKIRWASAWWWGIPSRSW